MTRLANFTPPLGTCGPDFGPHIAAAIGKPVRDAGVNPAEGAVVDGPTLAEADRANIQAAIASYVHDPTAGARVVTIFTLNGTQPVTWTNMPAAKTAVVGSQTRLPLFGASFARLTCDIGVAGFAGALLIAQVSLNGSTWTDGPSVDIGSTGLRVSNLVAIPEQFQTDCFFRLAGQGGNATADPQLRLTTLQVA